MKSKSNEIKVFLKKGNTNESISATIGSEIRFDDTGLKHYLLKNSDSLVYDALLVAAAIEFADKSFIRSSRKWCRDFSLKIPVYNLGTWEDRVVKKSLINVISFLTGDTWEIDFFKNTSNITTQGYLPIDFGKYDKILAYSDGLDSHIVSAIIEKKQNSLLRVRVCKGLSSQSNESFAKVPFNVTTRNRESSGRHRGFKFAMITSIAAHISRINKIIIPESGQGSIAPAIHSLGIIYPDYRNHPRFTSLMEIFIKNLFKEDIKFSYPQIWKTKGETIKEFIHLYPNQISELKKTKSCWKGNRTNSVSGKYMQCGACAACMLRRVSMFSASIEDSDYIYTNLGAKTMEDGVNILYKNKIGKSYRDYLIASILFMDDFANLLEDKSKYIITRHSEQLAEVMNIPKEMALTNLIKLIKVHKTEWDNFLNSIHKNAYIKNFLHRK